MVLVLNLLLVIVYLDLVVHLVLFLQVVLLLLKNEFIFQQLLLAVLITLSQRWRYLEIFDDRTYRFNVSDSSMTGRDFKLSETINGEYGPDGDDATTGDDGTEYTTGKTTNGTAGSVWCICSICICWSLQLQKQCIYYDGDTGTAANANYGGSDRSDSEVKHTHMMECTFMIKLELL